jgi:hypothetical protein
MRPLCSIISGAQCHLAHRNPSRPTEGIVPIDVEIGGAALLALSR